MGNKVDFVEKFNTGILDIIDMHSSYIYLINKNTSIKCSCINHETKQASFDCKKCLGTGRKITIRKIKAASQDTKLPPTMRSDGFVVARNYYLTNKYTIIEGDIIVDKKDIFIVFEIQYLISMKGNIPYQKVNSTKKKFDTEAFFNNFLELISKGK